MINSCDHVPPARKHVEVCAVRNRYTFYIAESFIEFGTYLGEYLIPRGRESSACSHNMLRQIIAKCWISQTNLSRQKNI